MIDLPSDLAKLIDQLNAADVEAADLVHRSSETQLNWRPNHGRSWSIAQNLDHLARTNKIYAEAMSKALERLGSRAPLRRGPLKLTITERLLLRIVEPPVRRLKFRTPATAAPAERWTGMELASSLRGAHAEVRVLATRAAELDCGRIRFRHPFARFLTLNMRATLAVIPAHNRRHLWQAQQVKTAPGYPALPREQIADQG
jgi:hypothetical protein